MPGGDRTGPAGPRVGKGRMGGQFAAGSGGYCKCPGCGYIVPHSRAQPCNLKQCPKCGTAMSRS